MTIIQYPVGSDQQTSGYAKKEGLVRDISLQESFWKGSFGNEYTIRNQSDGIISANIALFSKILGSIKSDKVNSIVEFGSNTGQNLAAIHCLIPKAEIEAVEINEEAYKQLEKLEYVHAVNKSLYEYHAQRAFDLSIMKGVLIHQNPVMLNKAYDILYESSEKYVLIAEYYNPTPVEVEYRGNKSVLFKRDFCGDMLDRYSDLRLIDYGFVYHRDALFPQDDITWFLMRKCKA